MTDDEALLAAIAAMPDDDLPRLVYADWLDEHGQQERAEFIRVECEAARTSHDSEAHTLLIRRSSRLRNAHAHRWFGPLAGEEIVWHIITSRGFIDTVVTSVDGFVAHEYDILQHAPLLRGLHIRGSGDWRAFFRSTGIERVRALSIEDGIFTPDAAVELSLAEGVRRLIELELDRQPLGADGVAAVAAAPLEVLERLGLSECGIGDDGAEALFASNSLRSVHDLDLSENGLTDTACRALAASPTFSHLEKLVVCDNHITAAGISALATAPHLSDLRTLNLYSNPIGPAGGRAILSSRHLGKLIELNLIGCGVGVAVVNDLRWVYGERAVKA